MLKSLNPLESLYLVFTHNMCKGVHSFFVYDNSDEM